MFPEIPKLETKHFVLFFGILILSCLVLTFAFFFGEERDKYCNTSNELYFAMRESSEQLLQILTPGLNRPSLDLILPSGRQARVFAEYWLTEDESPIFYVSTQPSWPGTTIGQRGLFYTPTGSLPIYEMSKITELSAGIYCYKVE